MRVTSVVITLDKNFDDGLLAYASIQFDDVFRVSGIRIYKRESKLLVGMPCRQCADNKYRDEAYPITQPMRDEINREDLRAYSDVVGPEAAKSEKVGGTK